MSTPRSENWSPTDVRLLSSGLRQPCSLQDPEGFDEGTEPVEQEVVRVASPCRQRPDVAHRISASLCSDSWLESPSSSSEIHNSGHEEVAISEVVQANRPRSENEGGEGSATGISSEVSLRPIPTTGELEVRAGLQQCQKELRQERERHAAVEAYWRQQTEERQQRAEELIASIHDADLGLIRREAIVADREARNEELSKQLAKRQEDLDAEFQDLAAIKLMVAEKQLALQDCEEDLKRRESIMKGLEAQHEQALSRLRKQESHDASGSKRSSNSSYCSVEGVPTARPAPPVSPALLPTPPSGSPPTLLLDGDEIPENFEEHVPQDLDRRCSRLQQGLALCVCGAGATFVLAFLALWKMYCTSGQWVPSFLGSAEFTPHVLAAESLGNSGPEEELSSAGLVEEEALMCLITNFTPSLKDLEGACDKDSVQELQDCTADPSNSLSEADYHAASPQSDQEPSSGDDVPQGPEGPTPLWRHVLGAALGVAAFFSFQ
eukprot:TRINITY_DN5996_c1_g1_i1.p1 TRINITY_DN5996_c1_g1~~TRINITY_DN5996_c1_g1_i1.p1  ORF type:complete len:493 (+),score=100.73 TRINITY_DN5996_c1_g1_i1:210-1688(+)